MKAGKFILGFEGMDLIVKGSDDENNAMQLLAGLASESIVAQQAVVGTTCGFTSRTRYIEDLIPVGGTSMNGWLLEYKVGPNPAVDDPEKYVVKQFFCEVDAQGKLVLVHRFESNLNEQDPM